MTISVSKQVNRINSELVVSQPKTPNSIRKLAIPQRAVDLLVEEHSKHPHSPYLTYTHATPEMMRGCRQDLCAKLFAGSG